MRCGEDVIEVAITCKSWKGKGTQRPSKTNCCDKEGRSCWT